MDNKKVTKYSPPYEEGYAPTFSVPNEMCECRYLIGREGRDPLVALCMNPSAANEETSDSTVNRVIKRSYELEKDGWAVINIYPERATDAMKIETTKQCYIDKNVTEIEKYLLKNNIREVWGAWGDIEHNEALCAGREAVLEKLKELNVKVYYYGSLTKKNNPRHALQRRERIIFSEEHKHYLE